MSMNLATALHEAGCTMDAQTFRDLVKAVFLERHALITDEDLYCEPTEAMAFANEIRRRARAPQMADRIPLRTLTSIRKRGELPRLKDRGVSTGKKPARVHANIPAKARARKAATKAQPAAFA